MAEIELDHVQLAAPRGCESEARRFFGELLGLPEVEKPESLKARGGAWFQVGSQQLHIGVEEPFAPARKAHPAPQDITVAAKLGRSRTHRVGKPLLGDLAAIWSARRRTYRVLYRIADEPREVVVLRVEHRRDAYRPH